MKNITSKIGNSISNVVATLVLHHGFIGASSQVMQHTLAFSLTADNLSSKPRLGYGVRCCCGWRLADESYDWFGVF